MAATDNESSGNGGGALQEAPQDLSVKRTSVDAQGKGLESKGRLRETASLLFLNTVPVVGSMQPHFD